MEPESPPPPAAHSSEIFSDATTRVTRHTLLPGHSTGTHTHEFDYVVIPVRGGTVQVDTDTSSFEFTLVAREPYARDSGITHCLTNFSDSVVDFFEVEYL